MDDETFKINKSNILFIVIDVVIFALVIVSIVLLVNSFKDESDLPDLEVTKSRTSTSVLRTTTEYVPPTTTTTARRELNSPYYNVDVNNLLTDEILKKNDLTNEEALEVMKTLYSTVDKIFNTSDNSLLDIATTLEYVKAGENDVITVNDNKYGIIYNSDALLKKCFSNYFMINEIGKYKYNNNRLFIKRNDNYYRLENKLGDVHVEISEFVITNNYSGHIEANMRYYKSNYKEMGYSSPVYQLMVFKATYELGRWKISEIDYPLCD